MAAAAPATELLAGDCENLDACLRQLRVGGLVALVGHDHARGERDDVVAVVPLVPFGFELVAAGRDDRERLEPESILNLFEEGALRELRVDASLAVRAIEDREDLRDDGLLDRHQVAIAVREHGV